MTNAYDMITDRITKLTTVHTTDMTVYELRASEVAFLRELRDAWDARQNELLESNSRMFDKMRKAKSYLDENAKRCYELKNELRATQCDLENMRAKLHNEVITTDIESLKEALQPLVEIAVAWTRNELDDEARRWYGPDDSATYSNRDPRTIELYTGRGGKRLLTLSHCLEAKAIYEGTSAKAANSISKMRRLPMSSFELSTRVMNCFNNNDIHTVDDLIRWTRKDLLRINNFGYRCMREVDEILQIYDIELKDE